MTKISHKQLGENLKKQSVKLLFANINNIPNVEKLEKFLETFFTPKEKEIILRRLAVMVLLNRNESYRYITQLLEISRTTVSKIKHISLGDGYGRNLKKIKYVDFYTKTAKKGESEKLFPRYKGAPRLF